MPFPYRRDAVKLRWFQGGVQHTMDGLHLDGELESAEAMTIVIELRDDGHVKAYPR
jgi:hypothetical protein